MKLTSIEMIDYKKNNLDFFRIIATVQVFLGHFISHFTFSNEYTVFIVYFIRGVPILFALCGFFAAKSFEAIVDNENNIWGGVKSYWINRMKRILPEFWLCIIINTLVISVVYEITPSVSEGIIYLVTQFFGMNFYTGGWLRGYGVGTPNGVLWTIPVQLQFFLFVPIFHKLLKCMSLKNSIIVVIFFTLISIITMRICLYLPEIVGKLIGVTVIPYLYFLILGMVIWYHRDFFVSLFQRYRYFILFGYVIWKICEKLFVFTHIFDGVLYNVITTLLLVTLVFSFGFIRNWHMKNDLTYGFYLYHMVFINLVIHFGLVEFVSWRECIIVFCAIVLITILCAWLSKNIIKVLHL